MFGTVALTAVATSLAVTVSDGGAASPPGIDFEQVFASRERAPTFAHPDIHPLFSSSSTTDLEPGTTGAIARPLAPDPWWVVVASVRDAGARDGPTQTIRNKLASCGLQTSEAPSSRVVGFRPGYIAVVVGPLPTKAEASRVLEAARPCAADANIRQAKQLAK